VEALGFPDADSVSTSHASQPLLRSGRTIWNFRSPRPASDPLRNASSSPRLVPGICTGCGGL
jgi:hypothetical protein